jgi:hypothetical protein
MVRGMRNESVARKKKEDGMRCEYEQRKASVNVRSKRERDKKEREESEGRRKRAWGEKIWSQPHPSLLQIIMYAAYQLLIPNALVIKSKPHVMPSSHPRRPPIQRVICSIFERPQERLFICGLDR